MDRNLLTIAANGNAVPVNVPQIRQQMQPVIAEIETQAGRRGDLDPIGRPRTVTTSWMGSRRCGNPDRSSTHRTIENPGGKGNGDQFFFALNGICQNTLYYQRTIPNPNLEVIVPEIGLIKLTPILT